MTAPPSRCFKALVLALAALGATGCEHAGQATKPAAASQELSAPSGVRIVRATTSGSGCPAGTSSSSVFADGTDVEVSFSNYFLQRTTDVQSRACSVVLEVEAPPGRSVAVKEVSLSGYAYHTATVRSELYTSYSFVGATGSGPGGAQGDGAGGPASWPRQGPLDGPFHVRDVVDDARLTFSACRRPSKATIETRLVLRDSARGYGYVNLLNVDGVKLITRPCGDPTPDAGTLDAGPGDGLDGGPRSADAGISPDGQVPGPGALPKITSVDAEGSLCPADSIETEIIKDGTDVDLTLRSPASPTTSRLSYGSCIVSIGVTPPPGHRLTVDALDARALVSLNGSTQTRLISSFWFTSSNAEQESAMTTAVVGPTGEAAFDADFTDDAARPYSDCAMPSLLNVRLRAAPISLERGPADSIRISRVTGLKLRVEPCAL